MTTAFWSPGQDELLKPFATAFFALVPEINQWGMMLAMTYTRTLFPLFGVDSNSLEQVHALAADAQPVIRAHLLGRADLVGRMLRARG